MWNRAENKIKGIFIRHGSTVSNREHKYLGRTDEPLEEAGIQKLRHAVLSGVYDSPDMKEPVVYSSPLIRCIQTAQILYPDAEYRTEEAFSEMDFGAFEGKDHEQLSTDSRYQKAYQAWIDSGGVLPFPDGESREAFMKRCVNGFERVMRKTEPEKPVAFVVHGGTIMAIFSHYCSGDYFDYQVGNGCGFRCNIEHTQDGYMFTDIEAIHI